MTFQDLLNLCIQRSARRSGASAAETIGVSRGTFSHWYVKSESGKLPSPDYWPKIAELSGQNVHRVAFIILAEMSKNPDATRVYKELAA